jgi:hypothetical protein
MAMAKMKAAAKWPAASSKSLDYMDWRLVRPIPSGLGGLPVEHPRPAVTHLWWRPVPGYALTTVMLDKRLNDAMHGFT